MPVFTINCSLITELGFELYDGAPDFDFVSDTPIGDVLNEKNVNV